jgi:anti-sigma factor RsiW
MALMASAAPLHRAPAGLRSAVEQTLSSPPRRAALRWPAALAAGLLLAGAAAWQLWPREQPASLAGTSEFAALGVDTHLRYARGQLPLEVRSERPHEVAGWFGGRVPFQLALPDYPMGLGEQKPYTLVGGRLISFHGDYAAYVVYRMEGRPISLLVTAASTVRPEGGVMVTSGPLTFHLESVAGLKVITWTDRGDLRPRLGLARRRRAIVPGVPRNRGGAAQAGWPAPPAGTLRTRPFRRSP